MAYPAFEVVRQMENVFGRKQTVVKATTHVSGLSALGAINSKGELSVLLANSAGPGKVVVGGFKLKAKVIIEVRDRFGRNISHAVANGSGTINVAVPTRSVLTIVPSTQ